MQSTLKTQPSWLEIVPNENKSEDFYGFDSTGMWFAGNSADMGGTIGYPIRTNFDFNQNDILNIEFTFIYDMDCSDQGICIFNSNIDPEWSWEVNETRIAFSINCSCPVIYGLSIQTDECDEDDSPLEEGNTYTAKVIYNPSQGTFSVYLYEGNSTSGALVWSDSINESLGAGPYRVGFDADRDEDENKSYFTRLSLNESTSFVCPSDKCEQLEQIGFSCKNVLNNTCKCKSMVIIRDGYVPAITACALNL